jgi:folate-binding protein YgfZ
MNLEERNDSGVRQGCSFAERPTDLLLMRGTDRLRFLGGYLTCDIKSLTPGSGIYGFVTEVKGHILADVHVLAAEDTLWLALPEGRREQIAEHLRKYVIMDRVEIVLPTGQTAFAVPDQTAFAVAGPDSAKVLGLLEGVDELPENILDHIEAKIGAHTVRLVREAPDDGVARWTLWAPTELAAELSATLTQNGGRSAEPEAFEQLRVEAGRPLFGRDFGPKNFPQETGQDAVSYTKGCFLGQEVVARIHYRGGVNRQLRGLVFDAEGPRDHQVLHKGREAGTVTSSEMSPLYGHIGLAILHKRVEPGSRVELEGGGTAGVVELPFSRSPG